MLPSPTREGVCGLLTLRQDYIRGQYKSQTGSDMPIKDKETKLG